MHAAPDAATGDGVLRITAKTMEIAFAKSKTSTSELQIVAVPRAENAEAVKAVEAIQPSEPILRSVTKGGEIGSRRIRRPLPRSSRPALASITNRSAQRSSELKPRPLAIRVTACVWAFRYRLQKAALTFEPLHPLLGIDR